MFKLESKTTEEKREAFVEVDGVEFTVPVGNFPLDFCLRYLDHVDKFGLDSAMIWLLEHGPSKGCWDALKGVQGLEPEKFQAIIEALQSKVIGTLQPLPKGKLKAV